MRLFPDITRLSSSLDTCQGYGNPPVPTLPAGAIEGPQAAALQTSSPSATTVPGPQGTLPCARTGCRVCGVLTRDPTQEQQMEETHRASGGGGGGGLRTELRVLPQSATLPLPPAVHLPEALNPAVQGVRASHDRSNRLSQWQLGINPHHFAPPPKSGVQTKRPKPLIRRSQLSSQRNSPSPGAGDEDQMLTFYHPTDIF